MNKGIIIAEGLKFFDIITLNLKEKLAEYEAPPWSPGINKLSPITKSITPFSDTFESCADTKCFNSCNLEFRSPEPQESTLVHSTSENTVKVSLPPTPRVRKPINVIMSRIRRIDFNLPEDCELQVNSTTDDNNDVILSTKLV